MGVEAAFELAAVVLLFATLIVAATTDLLHRRVYNWTTLPAVAFGLTLAWASGGWGGVGADGLVDRLAGFALAGALFTVAWWGRGVGGGDVKLMAAIGAIMGLHFVVGAMFWSALLGAVLAIWALVWQGRLLAGLRRGMRYGLSLRREEPPEGDLATVKIPYGVAISFGTLWCWFLTELPHA